MPENAGIVFNGFSLLILVLLGSLYLTPIHYPGSDRCIDTKPDLFQPLATHLHPRNGLIIIAAGADFNLLVLRFVWSQA